jgi:arylsulfatase A-like enzyme
MTCRRPGRTFVLLFLLGAALGPAMAPPVGAEPPNVILILTDNLGYGDIGPFGNTLHRTPRLDRMAAEGRIFTQVNASAGVCTPSRASLMTGCYAQRVSLHQTPRDLHVLRPVSPYGLHPDEITVAEALRDRGYATAMIGKWHLGDQPEFLPTRQGFDRFFGIPYSEDMTERIWDRDGSGWPPVPLLEDETVVEAPVARDDLTLRYTERALEWIRAFRDGPFFLFLSHAMPGSTPEPFASAAFRGRSRNGPWGDAVEELDDSTGRILDELRSLGLDRRTCVLWTSDNGAPLARNPEDPSRGTNRPLPGRGYTTDEGGFRVPMLAWWPGTIPAGTRCGEFVTLMDLMPTLCHLAGGVPPGDRTVDGRDIRPLLLGEDGARSPHEAFAYYERDQLQAVRSGPWKLFLPLETFERHPRFRPGSPAEPLLFHLENDVAGRENVLAAHPDVVARLTAVAETFRAELGDRGRPGAGVRPAGRVDQPTPRTRASDGAGNLR